MNTDVDLIVHINNVTSAPILSKQGLDTLVSPPHDINTLADIRAAGGISSDLAESMPDEAEGLAVLEAHAYLEPISSDIPTREALINQGYADSVDIASRPRDSFVAEMEGAGIDNQVAATIHARAVATERIVNNIITGRRVELANGFEGAEPLDIPELDPPPCECRETISAVSPLAYLTDLLNYVMKHVTCGEGKDPVSLDDLEDLLHQPFQSYLVAEDEVERKVRQVRICIEVIRDYRKGQFHLLPDLAPYLQQAYEVLLNQIGTSFYEIREIRTAAPDRRQALAARLGISLPDELDGLLLDPETLTEYSLESLFGLRSTTDEVQRFRSGSTPRGSTNWQPYRVDGRLRGIYVDVSTQSVGFKQTPLYFTTLHGDNKHWEAVGVTSVYNRTATGFRVYVRYSHGGALTPEFANENGWHIRWIGVEVGANSGLTPPNETEWQAYQGQDGSTGIFTDVDTSAAGFSATPIYLTSLAGDGWHWATTGVTSLHNVSHEGFRVYVRFVDGQELTPEFANEKGWHIQWVGVENSKNSGSTPAGEQWQQLENKDGDAIGIRIEVDTSGVRLNRTPTYLVSVTAQNDTSSHWDVTGCNSIYGPTAKGFWTYLRNWDGAPLTTEDASAAKWRIEWVAVEPSLLDWRLQHLCESWEARDWPLEQHVHGTGASPVHGQLLPIIDPDLIGPDDFRHPIETEPNSAFGLWLKRREWVDTVLMMLASSNENGNLSKKVLQAKLDCPNTRVLYEGAERTPWTTPVDVLDLIAYLADLKKGVNRETVDAWIGEHNLTTESFIRLAEIALLAADQVPIGDDDWKAVDSILTQVVKTAFFSTWREEEEAHNVSLDPRIFWLALSEPEEGLWSPALHSLRPLIDPDHIDLDDLAAVPVGETAREIWNIRQSDLQDAWDTITSEYVSDGLEGALTAVLGKANALGQTWREILKTIDQDLKSLNVEVREQAQKQIRDVFHMSETDFLHLVLIMEKEDDPDSDPTEQDIKQLVDILTEAHKLAEIYPEWIEGEQSLPYWRVLKTRLPYWRASIELRQQWQQALRFWCQPPMIDPDVIGPGDLRESFLATTFDIWQRRHQYLENRWVQLKSEREGAQNEADWLYGAVEKTVGVSIDDLADLAAMRDEGEDISKRLPQLNLDVDSLQYLLRIQTLVDNGTPIKQSEWEDLYALLVLVEKRRLHAEWRLEERMAGLVLSPENFRLPEEEPEPSSMSRLNWKARRNWKGTLNARIEQQHTVLNALGEAVDTCEEQTLTILRDALIAVTRQTPEWLTDHLLIDCETGACQKTTRIAQAITTLQNLLFALRTGQYETEENQGAPLELVAPDFDEEWKWISSYETWKAAIGVFLYPENILLPSLNRQQTPAFRKLVEAVRSNRRLTPESARQLASEYEEYFRDVCSLHPCAHVQTFDDENRPKVYVIASSVRGNIQKLYMSSYNPYDSTGDTQTPWEEIVELHTADIIEVIGTHTRIIDNRSFIYLYLQIRVKEENENGTRYRHELAYLKYDLAANRWDDEPTSLNLPDGVMYYVAVVAQGCGAWADNDRHVREHAIIALWPAGTEDIYVGGVIEEEINWLGPASSSEDWTVADHKIGRLLSLVRGPLEDHYTLVCMDWDFPETFYYWVFSVDDIVPGRSIYWQSRTKEAFYFVGSLAGPGGVYLFGRNGSVFVHCLHLSDRDSLEESVLDYKVKSFGHLFADSAYHVMFVLDGDSKYRGYYDIIHTQNVDIPKHWFIITHTTFEIDDAGHISGTLKNRIIPTFSMPSSIGLNPHDLNAVDSDGHTPSEAHYRKNSKDDGTYDGMILYGYEAFFAVPLTIALGLQREGHYTAALDWFRAVYDYTMPIGIRKRYYGLREERTLEHGYAREPGWLLDPLDVHAIARTRRNTYTRFTLMSIVRCLLAYADAEFTRDTAESLATARTLYDAALDLLDVPELNQHLDECEGIIGYLDTDIPVEEDWQEDQWHQLLGEMSRIQDPNLLNHTVKEVKTIVAGDHAFVDRLRMVRKIIDSAVMQQKPLVVGEVLARQKEINRAVQKYAFRDQSVISVLQKTVLRLDAPFPPVVMTENGDEKPLTSTLGGGGGGPDPGAVTGTFCIPPNPLVASLRLYAENNLHKLRTCRNIVGVKREVDVYAAPIDILSSMPAIGPGGQIVLPMRTVPPPVPYRYEFLIEQAKQLANIAGQMEAALLSAMEKSDNERYNLLRARQDAQLARAGVRVQNLRLRQSMAEVKAAELQRDSAQLQFDTYSEWIETDMLQLEKDVIEAYQESAQAQFTVASLDAAIASANAFATAASGFTAGGHTFALAVAAGSAYRFWAMKDSIEAEKRARIASVRAAHERRKQEWQLQLDLANLSVSMGEQQIKIAEIGVDIAEQEKRIAQIRVDHAEEVVEFLHNKETNTELYDWMTDILENVYSFFLQRATAMAKLAQSQLAFERQQMPPAYIQNDYWEAPSEGMIGGSDEDSVDRHGLTGSARLLADIYRLDQYRIETAKRKLQLTKIISISQFAPFELQRFRETGVLTFATPMDMFDRDFPGHYMRMIRLVRTSVVALIPSTQGIKATLSNIGVSRIAVNNGGLFQTIVAQRAPESVALTSPINATGVVELQTPGEMMLPFEGLGVDTVWGLRMPKAANPFDYRTIADVLLTIEYSALDSHDYRQRVLQELDNTVLADRPFSLRNQFVDQWYRLHNPEQGAPPRTLTFETVREDFPPNVEELKIAHILLYFSLTGEQEREVQVRLKFRPLGGQAFVGGEAMTIDGVISTRRGNAGPWASMIGCSPIGEWELALTDTPEVRQILKEGEIEDILFVITYSGRMPDWPE